MNVEPKEIAVFVNPEGENQHLKSVLEILGQMDSSEVTVLGHRESLPAYARFPSLERKERLERVLEQAAQSTCESFSNLATELGLKCRTSELLSGRFPQCLTDWIDGSDTDLVIKQSLHTDKAFGFASKGDLKLTRASAVPVLLLNQPMRREAPILVGIEPLLEDHSRDRFCLKLVNTACVWAKLLGAKVHVVHAWQLWGEGLVNNRVPQEEIDEALEDQKKCSEAAVERIIKQAQPSDVDVVAHVKKGLPDNVLSEAIDEHNPGLLIMGSAANEGVKKVFLGNTAENIVRSKECSVMILR